MKGDICTTDKMEDLFNNNIIFVFFFAMIAIYNYSELKEYQKMAIIYISIYALTILNIIGVKLAIALMLVSLFCFFEILTADELKFKILVNPFYKIVDAIYLSFSQYGFGEMVFALILLRIKLPDPIADKTVVFKILSTLLVILSLTVTLQQKYIIHTFDEMYKIFIDFPINKTQFNQKLNEACYILTSVEDKLYFERNAYTFLSPKYIIKILKNKIKYQKGNKKIACIIRAGSNFAKNIFDESRGYSTIPMQLIRSLGIKSGYNCKYRRKVFEFIYSRMFFQGIKKMLENNQVVKREHFKEYLLYIYFHKVNTFLGDAKFSKFLNAFDMKYNQKNDKDIYDCSNEGIFVACMGLSKRANYITKDNINRYLEKIDNVELNAETICDMVEKMMDKPYDGNYLK